MVNVISFFAPPVCEATVMNEVSLHTSWHYFNLSISSLHTHTHNPLLTHIKSLLGETALNTVQVFVFFCALTDFVPDITDDVFGQRRGNSCGTLKASCSHIFICCEGISTIVSTLISRINETLIIIGSEPPFFTMPDIMCLPAFPNNCCLCI